VEFEYRYSPYTGKLDRTRSTNQSGNNITADNAEFTNLLVENPPVNCSTGYYMIGTNMETSWCMLDDDSDKLENGTDKTVHFGKVGIGTSTPSVALDVNGSVKVDGDTEIIGDLRVNDSVGIGTNPDSGIALKVDKSFITGVENIGMQLNVDRTAAAADVFGMYAFDLNTKFTTQYNSGGGTTITAANKNLDIQGIAIDDLTIASAFVNRNTFSADSFAYGTPHETLIGNVYYDYLKQPDLSETMDGTLRIGTLYGYYVGNLINDKIDTSWAFYNDGETNIFMGKDNAISQWGFTKTDLQIYSDGTNGIINVSNQLKVLGDLNVTGNATADIFITRVIGTSTFGVCTNTTGFTYIGNLSDGAKCYE